MTLGMVAHPRHWVQARCLLNNHLSFYPPFDIDHVPLQTFPQNPPNQLTGYGIYDTIKMTTIVENQ